MLVPYIRTYMIHGLRATPHVVAHLLEGATEDDFDRKPDPDRFSIREVVAHLADWDPVWLERSGRIINEDRPTLQSYDEGQWAIDHDYAHLDVAGQIDKLHREREQLAAYLDGLTAEQWERVGMREFGPISIAQQTAMILGHDGYHLKQISDWLKAGR